MIDAHSYMVRAQQITTFFQIFNKAAIVGIGKVQLDVPASSIEEEERRLFSLNSALSCGDKATFEACYIAGVFRVEDAEEALPAALSRCMFVAGCHRKSISL